MLLYRAGLFELIRCFFNVHKIFLTIVYGKLIKTLSIRCIANDNLLS